MNRQKTILDNNKNLINNKQSFNERLLKSFGS